MRYLLLTRPHEDSERLARLSQIQGYDPIIEPLLTPIYLEDKIVVPGHLQSVLITSKQALKSLTRLPEFPVFQKIELICAGEKTAELAQEVGIQKVFVAGEAVDQMMTWIKDNRTLARGPFLYLHGDVVTKDIRTHLEESGYQVLTQKIYEMVEAQTFSSQTLDLIQRKIFHGITFFSPRTARIFVSMAHKFKLETCFSKTYAFCLSSAVAQEIEVFSWQGIEIAKSPTEAALMELL